MIDWEKLGLTPTENLPDDTKTEIEGLVSEIGDIFHNRPQALTDVRQVFARHLGALIGPDTLAILGSGLERILGEEHTQIVMWLLTQIQNDYDLDWLSDKRAKDTVSELSSVYALYGPELESAAQRAGELSENWESIGVQRLFDIDNGAHRLRVTLNKYSGETVFLEADPNSVLRLSTHLNNILASLEAPDAFDPVVVEEYVQASQALIESLKQEDLESM